MDRLEIKVEVPSLAKRIAAARNLRPAFQKAIAAWRSVGQEEFDRESWRPRSGALRPWKATKPFASESAFTGGKILQRTGQYLRAWLGGSGGFERVEEDRASFGVTGKAALLASVHRGAGTAADSLQPTRIKVTPKMRIFLGLVKGVWLRKTTTEIVIPKRPHFTDNPEAATRITAIFAAHVSGRETPERLVA